MNYRNKTQLPENISSINDVSEYYDHNINDLITYLFKKSKINKHDILVFFREYFKNVINKKIQNNYIDLIEKFSNSILPIIFKSKYPRQGTYQLLRFLDYIQPNFEFIETLINNSFSHNKISDILTFSGHATNLLSKDIKLLEILDPYFEIKLNKNINIHGTMFAGSIFSLATLTGWGMIYLQLKERGLDGDIVLGDGDIHYHKPITMKPRAICNIETLSGKFKPLENDNKARFELSVAILDGDTPVAEFEGVCCCFLSANHPVVSIITNIVSHRRATSRGRTPTCNRNIC